MIYGIDVNIKHMLSREFNYLYFSVKLSLQRNINQDDTRNVSTKTRAAHIINKGPNWCFNLLFL